jgi:hypothetical protein
MSNGTSIANEETRLAEYLVNRVCDRALGRGEDECLRNYPRDVYFVGNLRPRQEDPEPRPDEPGHLRELLNKLAPVAFGAEFLLRPTGDTQEVTITLAWACYYRVFPTLLQQQQHQPQARGPSQVSGGEAAPEGTAPLEAGEEPETEASQPEEDEQADLPGVPSGPQPTQRRRRVSSDSLFIRFKKIPCSTTGILRLRRDAGDLWTPDYRELQASLDLEMARAALLAQADPERIRTASVEEDQVRVPETALASEATYQAFCATLTAERPPRWRWELRCELRQVETATSTAPMLTAEFVNLSPMPPNSPITEAFLFDSHAKFAFAEGVVQPFELDLAPRSFRYDRNVWGRGLNCAVVRTGEQSNLFWTTHVPVSRQMRFVTRTAPSARFVDLAGDPIPTLAAILAAMESYRQNWATAREAYIASSPDWEASFAPEFDRDRQQYQTEIDQFRRGLDLIRTNADVRLAFQLTNESFRRGPRTEWRLFQIVFLVSQLPGMAGLSSPTQPCPEREIVDVIYFPTGGGKTEAYLGTAVFHCFFDRLREKTAGVTAWTRFPLRLLTLQQTQRVADAIGLAELVRREQRDPRLSGSGVDGFAVGYFVGAEATPNEFVDPATVDARWMKAADSVNWSQAADQVARQRWLRVSQCPACRTRSVRVDFDPATARILHRCGQPGCAFPNGLVPVYVVDNDIFRYLPAVIVGTIDKLASLGNQRKLALIFGQVDGRCSVHGYYKGKCCQKGCKDPGRLRPGIPRGVSGPTLFVQDELHLLKEGLGTFDAHYETFTQRLEREFGQPLPIKVIASSATIEAFSRQVEHLYGRAQTNARVFPGLA